MKKYFTLMMLAILVLHLATVRVATAANAGGVVINEIAWAGSVDSASDEWIELYNTTNQPVDLSGWYIEDDGNTIYEIGGGEITPYGYFLIEKNEEAVSDVLADAIIGLSLANTGDSLVLHDFEGVVIDAVNTGGGSWYAGSNTDKASMERIDPAVSGDVPENWADALSGNGNSGSLGGALLATPGGVNSNYGGPGPTVAINPGEVFASSGESVTFTLNVSEAFDLYAYGFEIRYDPAVMDFISVEEGDFLKGDGATTSFNAGLEDGEKGKLLVGNARLNSPATGIDGEGRLFDITFQVIGPEGSIGGVTFSGDSFLADSLGDTPAKLSGALLTVGQRNVESVQNLIIQAGEDRYSLTLNWMAPNEGADTYIIEKAMPDGSYSTIAQVPDTFYTDRDSIMPHVEYIYRITAVSGGAPGAPLSASGIDERGIRGDMDRSDRVDGRDIEKLARSYATIYGEDGYDISIDVNYDGLIDGSDLIDIGVNFGLTF